MPFDTVLTLIASDVNWGIPMGAAVVVYFDYTGFW